MNVMFSELSEFHIKIYEQFKSIHYVLEVTSSVSLVTAPPISPKGFKNIFEHIGGAKGNTFPLHFSGQHSCVSTSSGPYVNTSRLLSRVAMGMGSQLVPSPAWQM